MNILLIAARDPSGRAMGRKIVLRTILSSLESLGHVVTLAIVGPAEPGHGSSRLCGGSVEYLGRPGLFRILLNVAAYYTRRKMSLNECLYFSPRVLEEIRRIAVDNRCELVVADMIRTALYAGSLGLPWVLDLDDLLSKRYADMTAQRKPVEMILGYYGDYLPGRIRTLASHIANIMLRKESLIIGDRERTHAGEADAVCLVAEDEVNELSRRIGRPVYWMPMAVNIPSRDRVARSLDRPLSMVFTGGLDYQPNLDAIRYYLREIVPALDAAGLSPSPLGVIGFCPDSVRAELATDRLRLLGYVDDLYSEMSKYQLFLAPIVSGTGIKTKVLEAMALGLPVLSTPEGVKGMKVSSGKECYVAGSPGEFARLMAHIDASPEEAARVGLGARRYVQENFSFDRLQEKWNDVLGSALRTFEESSKV